MNITRRMSDSFILLDFLYGYDSYTNIAQTNHFLQHALESSIQLGERFCQEFLEPLITQYGPCSVANGLRFGCKGPHLWQEREGVAADVVFHDWVNQDLAPVRMLGEIDQDGYEFERVISYAGSEFVCLAWKPNGGNRSAFYENVRKKNQAKPLFITHGRTPEDRAGRIGKPIPARNDWRREPLEPIYHTQRQLRAQHIRVGQYFTLLDMCRNARAFAAGLNTVIPSRFFNSHRVQVARMFAEVLDPLVEQFGRVSITQGMEPADSRIERDPLHRWTADAHHGQAALKFMTSTHHEPLGDHLFRDSRVATVEWETVGDSIEYTVVIDQFEPTKQWSSAK